MQRYALNQCGVPLEIFDDNNLRAKGQDNFRRKNSTIDHILTFHIIVEDCQNDKEYLFVFFVDFEKSFDIVPKNKILEYMAKLNLPSKLRFDIYRLYEQVTFKLKTNQGWYEEISYNVIFKQGCPLFATLFGIYIDQLENYIK